MISDGKGFKLPGLTPPEADQPLASDTQRLQCLTGSSRDVRCEIGCRRLLRSSLSPLSSKPHERRFPQGSEDPGLPTSEQKTCRTMRTSLLHTVDMAQDQIKEYFFDFCEVMDLMEI